MPTAESAAETAYYFNGKLPLLAMIAKGVRFPAGQWLRVAGHDLPAWRVQEMIPEMFGALKGRPVRFVALLTDFDVEEFERGATIV